VVHEEAAHRLKRSDTDHQHEREPIAVGVGVEREDLLGLHLAERDPGALLHALDLDGYAARRAVERMLTVH